jgi:hypothetical protein
MEPNPGEKEAIVEQQEIPNEEVVIHSLKACQKETTSHESTNTEKTEPDPVMMQSMGEHQEVPKEEATVKSWGAMKKRHRG